MSCTQVTACQLAVYAKNRYTSHSVSCAHINIPLPHINFSKPFLAVAPCTLKLRRHGPVCLFGNKGKSGNTDEGSPWKALEKVMGNFKKEPSVEDLLKQQIAKKEFFKDGGNIGGGGGSGGGGSGSSGESEDEGSSGVMDEVLQVTLATIGIVFLYIYIIDGEDINALVKDFIKFIFTGKQSIRLGRVFHGWSRFLQQFTYKPEVQENWLEYAIINTPTWYDGPNKYKRILRDSLGLRSIADVDELISRSCNNDDEDEHATRSDDDDDGGL